MSVGRWRRIVGAFALGLIVSAVCVGAGLWQLERLEQRRAFNSEVRANIAQPAQPAATLLRVGKQPDPSLQWRTLTFTGTFDLGEQVLIRGRYFQGRYGYEVITPLLNTEGVALLVNRGWVPAGESATSPPIVPAPPSGQVSIAGRLRMAHEQVAPRGAIIGLPARAANTIDPEALADALPYPTLGGYVELIDQQPPQAEPRPVLAPELGEGPHLAYAVQWFFFALLALAAPVVFTRT